MTYFKVVATVHRVSPPSSQVPGEPAHVVMPCRMYKEGDTIVFEDNQINMEETSGALCLSLVASMIPVLKAMQRNVEPIVDKEEGVIFKIERIPQKVPGWIVAEKLALKEPGKRIHLHTPNPTAAARGDHDNLWEKHMKD